mmetsp:Transcript_1053/g.2090  ORF Transcript_1053/g.2090 Transcript_1053/m.2090 type:complete len:199 (+) Transcript_1053:64-660(+)
MLFTVSLLLAFHIPPPRPTSVSARLAPARAGLIVADADIKINVKKPEPKTEASEALKAATEQVVERTRKMLDSVAEGSTSVLAEGVSAPPAAAKLQAAYDEGDASKMYALGLEFLIDMELGYDVGDDGKCRPATETYDDPANEATRSKLPALYGQAMNMLYFAGPETSATIKEIVLEKLARRVGMEGAAFDEWALPLL